MIRPFGERGLLVELSGPDAAQRLDATLRAAPPPGLLGTVPGRSSVLVELDPTGADRRAIERAIETAMEPDSLGTEPGARLRSIPVVYGGEHGPDLAGVADLTGLSEADLVELHAASELRVQFLGFAPGFAYLGDLPDRLRVPRLDTPRTRTPAGSVAIAGPMTGVYPADLPGGWRVIGRTPLTLFDPRRAMPAYLAPGDRVRFVPIAPAAWDEAARPADDW